LAKTGYLYVCLSGRLRGSGSQKTWGESNQARSTAALFHIATEYLSPTTYLAFYQTQLLSFNWPTQEEGAAPWLRLYLYFCGSASTRLRNLIARRYRRHNRLHSFDCSRVCRRNNRRAATLQRPPAFHRTCYDAMGMYFALHLNMRLTRLAARQNSRLHLAIRACLADSVLRPAVFSTDSVTTSTR
jgi:hypothetical protein